MATNLDQMGDQEILDGVGPLAKFKQKASKLFSKKNELAISTDEKKTVEADQNEFERGLQIKYTREDIEQFIKDVITKQIISVATVREVIPAFLESNNDLERIYNVLWLNDYIKSALERAKQSGINIHDIDSAIPALGGVIPQLDDVKRKMIENWFEGNSRLPADIKMRLDLVEEKYRQRYIELGNKLVPSSRENAAMGFRSEETTYVKGDISGKKSLYLEVFNTVFADLNLPK